jgi:hypothetical protein
MAGTGKHLGNSESSVWWIWYIMALLDIPPDRGRTGGDTVELKPCPWCGGDVTIIYRSASNMFHVYHCDSSGKCDIVGPFKIHKSRATTLEEAAEVWNRRAETPWE